MTNKNALFKPTPSEQAKQDRYEEKEFYLRSMLEREINNENNDERALRIGLTYVLLNLEHISPKESVIRLNLGMNLFKAMIKSGQWIVKSTPNIKDFDFSSPSGKGIIDRLDKIIEKLEIIKTQLSLHRSATVPFEKFIELFISLPIKHLTFLKADDRCWLVMALLSPHFDEYEPFDCDTITAVLELLNDDCYKNLLKFPCDKPGSHPSKYLIQSHSSGKYESVDWLEYAMRLRKNSAAQVLSDYAEMLADPTSTQARLIAENKFYCF